MAGAASTLNSHTSLSINSADESWVAANSGSATRFFGAGAGTAPDISPLNTTGYRFAKYDANMNLVFNAQVPGNISYYAIAADPDATDQFYIAFAGTLGSAGSSYGGFVVTGQAAATTVVLAKCKIATTTTFTILWVRKIDGSSDEVITGIRAKDIGGVTKIAVSGITRSSSLSNYSDYTTTVAQTVNVLPAGTTSYDFFVSEYNGNGTPVWINEFGAATVNESNSSGAFEIDDAGDVLWPAFEPTNTAGSVNYVLTNNSAGGTTTGTYTTSVTGTQRFILFNFKGADGSINWTYDKLTVSPGTSAYPMALTSDAGNNIYLEMTFPGTFISGGTPAIPNLVSAGNYDVGVEVLDNTGNPVRAQRYGGTGIDGIASFSISGAKYMTLDRANNLLYLAGQSNKTFTSGTATLYVPASPASAYDGYLLCAGSTGTMSGVAAVSLDGSVASSASFYGAVEILSTGNVVAMGEYAVSATNSVNGGAATAPKTAYGYQDVAIAKFAGSTLVPTGAEGGWGGKTGNQITCMALQGGKLLSAGSFNGTMIVGSTTLSSPGANSGLLAITDTTTGVIGSAYSFYGGSNTIVDMKVNPADNSVYVLLGVSNTLQSPGGTPKGVNYSSNHIQTYLVKLNSSYVHQWTAEVTGTETTNPGGLEIDPATGDAYISGYFSSPSLVWGQQQRDCFRQYSHQQQYRHPYFF